MKPDARTDVSRGARSFSHRAGILLSRIAAWSFYRPWRALLLVAFLSALGLGYASRLRVDTDLAGLLPDSFPSVVALRELEKRGEVNGYIAVVLQGNDQAALRQRAAQLNPKLEALSTVRYVESERPWDWFKQRRLYYLSVERLQLLVDQLQDRTDWEVLRHVPMYVDLEKRGPPPVDTPKLDEANTSFLVGSNLEQRYYEDPQAGILVLLVRPMQRSTDLTFVDKAVGEVHAAVQAHLAAVGDTQTRFELTGRFAKKLEQKARLSADLRSSTLLALSLISVFLIGYFRSGRGMALVILPLVVGILWTLGIAGFAFGKLNILTAFIAAILLGLGIDHGIHLVSSIQAAHAEKKLGDATVSSFGRAGVSVLVAAATTAAGFFALAVSKFVAFHEFGVVAGFGMLAIVLSYLLLLPAMVALGGGLEPKRAVASGASVLSLAMRRVVSVSSGLLLLAIMLPVPGLRFNSDLSSLQDTTSATVALDREVNRILGHSQTPTVVLVESVEQEADVLARLKAGHAQAGSKSTVELLVGLSDIVPGQQAEKSSLLKGVDLLLDRIQVSSLSYPKDKADYQELHRMAKSAPFTRGDLPDTVLRRFYPPGGDPAGPGYVLAFPAIELGDGSKVTEFATQLRRAADGALVAGEALILADILGMIRVEGPLVLGLTGVSIVAVLWLLIGGLFTPLLPLSVAVISVLGALGISAFFQLPLNYLNVLMIPVLFGISVDGAIHLQAQRRAGSGLRETLRAVRAALLTTAFGFGSLLLAQHPGLRSLAWLALIGLGVNAVVLLVFIPAWWGGSERGAQTA